MQAQRALLCEGPVLPELRAQPQPLRPVDPPCLFFRASTWQVNVSARVAAATTFPL